MDILSYVLGYNKGKAQGGGEPLLQEKTATENGVVIADEGYDGLSKVTVAVEGGSSETDIFPLQTVEGFIEDTDLLLGSYFAYVPTFEIKDGETYYVKWDDYEEPFTCKGMAVSFNGINAVYLGNGSMLGYPSNDEPFAVIYFTDYGRTEFVAFNDTNTSHDIRVYQKAESSVEVKPLMVTANGTYTAPDGEAYSPVTVAVASGVVGEILPGYELEEIMPRTELTFRTGASTQLPYTPTAVIATKEDKANVPKLEEGDNGLVFWGNTLYAVTCGQKWTPMLPVAGGELPLGMTAVGNLGIPYVWGIGSLKLARLNNAGGSFEPFIILANEDYIIAADGEPNVWDESPTVHPSDISAEFTQLSNYFTGRGGYKRFEVDKTYNIIWNNQCYTCQARSGTLTHTEDGVVSVTYVGNGTIFGEADSGEPFVAFTRDDGVSSNEEVVALEPENLSYYNGDSAIAHLSIWSDKEFTQSVQIFKIKQKQYTVSFYDDDGVTLLNTKEVGHGYTAYYTPTKEGYIFKGWNPEPTNVTAPMDCYAQWEEKPSFAKSSWAKISEISQAGQASEYFALGDTRIETLNYSDGTSEEIELQIVAIGKDTTEDGTPTMTLVPKHLLTKTSGKVWTSSDELYSATKYSSNTCYTKAFLEGTVMPAMSSELQNVLQTACPTEIQTYYIPPKITSRGKISLLNYAEIGLTSLGANASSTDDVLYGFGNTEISRIRATADGTTHQWWELTISGFYLSPSVATSYKYKKCMVGTDGTFKVSQSDSSEITTHCLFKICV